jgi:putative hydrolase of the HAD superfamily
MMLNEPGTPQRNPAILIDLFDTIVSCEWRAVTKLLASYLQVEYELVDRALAETRRARNTGILGGAQADMRAVLQAFSPGRECPALEREMAAMLERFYVDNGLFYSDANRFLSAVRDAGIKVCMVSNCSRTADAMIKRLRLRDISDALILSYEVGACKPDPEIYRIAVSAVEADITRTSYIDDNPAFCDGASTQGLQAYRVHRDSPADTSPGVYPGLNDDLLREVSRIGLMYGTH